MTEYMNCFSGVNHTDKNEDLPALVGNESDNELLDYMVLAITRRLHTHKAFKGGYMLNQLLEGESRMTHDVDFPIANEDEYESVKGVLREIAEEFQKYKLIKEYKIKESIAPTSSGGIDFYDSDGKKFLGVDVGLHDISWGVKSYAFKMVTLDGFEIERMLSDKLIAIVSRKRFRRTKDLYDFFIITSSFDFDYKKLSVYIKNRGGAEWDNIPFNEDVIREYKKAWDKLSLIGSNTGQVLDKPVFEIALKQFYAVAIPLKSNTEFTYWSHERRSLR